MRKQKIKTDINEEVKVVKKNLHFALSSIANMLDGEPKKFADDYIKSLQILEDIGVAFDCGDNMWSRGHKWREYVKTL